MNASWIRKPLLYPSELRGQGLIVTSSSGYGHAGKRTPWGTSLREALLRNAGSAPHDQPSNFRMAYEMS